jgi:hypothetical protein
MVTQARAIFVPCLHDAATILADPGFGSSSSLRLALPALS